MFEERQKVAKLLRGVRLGDISVREALLAFPDNRQDKSILASYHALVHYEADEDLRKRDDLYAEEQDDYLEFIAQTLSEGKVLPKNIIDEYKPYYKGVSSVWIEGLNGFMKEFKRFINI